MSVTGQKAPEMCQSLPLQYWADNSATTTTFFIWVLGTELRSL